MVFTTSVEKVTYYVEIGSVPGARHFEFSTGLVGSYWTERDREFAAVLSSN